MSQIGSPMGGPTPSPWRTSCSKEWWTDKECKIVWDWCQHPSQALKETLVCIVKKKDNHEDPLDEEIWYWHLMVHYLLERQIHPVPMTNIEKGEMWLLVSHWQSCSKNICWWLTKSKGGECMIWKTEESKSRTFKILYGNVAFDIPSDK
jgi:hypothetical protein